MLLSDVYLFFIEEEKLGRKYRAKWKARENMISKEKLSENCLKIEFYNSRFQLQEEEINFRKRNIMQIALENIFVHASEIKHEHFPNNFEGELHKRKKGQKMYLFLNPINISWKKRQVILIQGYMITKAPLTGEITGTIFIQKCLISNYYKYPHSFKLDSPNGQYKFQADTEEDKEDWFLQLLIHGAIQDISQ